MITNEHELIERARQGDSEAFGQLVRNYQDRLFTAMSHLVGCHTEAEDVVQEALVSAFYELKRFRGDSAFYSWLYRIAHNKAISRRRRKRATLSLDTELQRSQLEPVDSGGGPTQPLECREQNERVRKALGRLSDSFRTILILREYEDLSYTDMAEVLGCSIGTVESRLFRARQRFKDALGRMYPDFVPGPAEGPTRRVRKGRRRVVRGDPTRGGRS